MSAHAPPPNWCRTCGKRPNDPAAVFCSDAFHRVTTPAHATATPEGDALPESWECFRDVGRFDMWCVRPIGSRKFGAGFHVARQDEAHHLRDYLNALASSPAPLGEAEVRELAACAIDIIERAGPRLHDHSRTIHKSRFNRLRRAVRPFRDATPQERQEAQGAER